MVRFFSGAVLGGPHLICRPSSDLLLSYFSGSLFIDVHNAFAPMLRNLTGQDSPHPAFQSLWSRPFETVRRGLMEPWFIHAGGI